ncbi:predicted protein [Chaetomium globosum CBS 148.51]|uniref:Uncharacterized protein n=1 Tax=Chaetomium globosum (strain ATCC 6205 / CBS 148.51 / DSM 1962 / NBRC 6347 / NRRL 1970) TaxID=306901 RepID=Q2GXI5_CHAGB|nr:uncharacterized protein CHGG_07319 [Chaetomium globosum CBS 148.51]EAQ86066.1 predicted protein [Chaetomium globosum CBS 148.51]
MSAPRESRRLRDQTTVAWAVSQCDACSQRSRVADFRLHRGARKAAGGIWSGCGHLDRCCLGPVQDLRYHRRSAVEATQQRVLCLFMQHVEEWMCCGRALQRLDQCDRHAASCRRCSEGFLGNPAQRS